MKIKCIATPNDSFRAQIDQFFRNPSANYCEQLDDLLEYMDAANNGKKTRFERELDLADEISREHANVAGEAPQQIVISIRQSDLINSLRPENANNQRESPQVRNVAVNETRRRTARYRLPYTKHTLECLEAQFRNSQTLTHQTRRELHSRTNLSKRQIMLWFQNRRRKERLQRKRLTLNQNDNLFV